MRKAGNARSPAAEKPISLKAALKYATDKAAQATPQPVAEGYEDRAREYREELAARQAKMICLVRALTTADLLADPTKHEYEEDPRDVLAQVHADSERSFYLLREAETFIREHVVKARLEGKTKQRLLTFADSINMHCDCAGGYGALELAFAPAIKWSNRKREAGTEDEEEED